MVTNQEMAAIDRRTIKEFGVLGIELMENAGRSVADKIDNIMAELDGKKILVVCGKGNNGGDGFVIARYLENKGAMVYMVLCENKDELLGDALTMFKRLSENIRFITVEKAAESHFDVVVDGVFGTGFHGTLDGKYTDIIKMINKCGSTVVAVDIPSGVNGNTGQ
ncbi:MAG: NAD(P)H-hydrate epimerase, partial [Lachnospiraceae bacterium]|nr:NAD(P)H-hydrate epimerase [Lachnospiraceae bacterium]